MSKFKRVFALFLVFVMALSCVGTLPVKAGSYTGDSATFAVHGTSGMSSNNNAYTWGVRVYVIPYSLGSQGTWGYKVKYPEREPVYYGTEGVKLSSSVTFKNSTSATTTESFVVPKSSLPAVIDGNPEKNSSKYMIMLNAAQSNGGKMHKLGQAKVDGKDNKVTVKNKAVQFTPLAYKKKEGHKWFQSKALDKSSIYSQITDKKDGYIADTESCLNFIFAPPYTSGLEDIKNLYVCGEYRTNEGADWNNFSKFKKVAGETAYNKFIGKDDKDKKESVKLIPASKNKSEFLYNFIQRFDDLMKKYTEEPRNKKDAEKKRKDLRDALTHAGLNFPESISDESPFSVVIEPVFYLWDFGANGGNATSTLRYVTANRIQDLYYLMKMNKSVKDANGEGKYFTSGGVDNDHLFFNTAAMVNDSGGYTDSWGGTMLDWFEKLKFTQKTFWNSTIKTKKPSRYGYIIYNPCYKKDDDDPTTEEWEVTSESSVTKTEESKKYHTILSNNLLISVDSDSNTAMIEDNGVSVGGVERKTVNTVNTKTHYSWTYKTNTDGSTELVDSDSYDEVSTECSKASYFQFHNKCGVGKEKLDADTYSDIAEGAYNGYTYYGSDIDNFLMQIFVPKVVTNGGGKESSDDGTFDTNGFKDTIGDTEEEDTEEDSTEADTSKPDADSIPTINEAELVDRLTINMQNLAVDTTKQHLSIEWGSGDVSKTKQGSVSFGNTKYVTGIKFSDEVGSCFPASGYQNIPVFNNFQVKLANTVRDILNTDKKTGKVKEDKDYDVLAYSINDVPSTLTAGIVKTNDTSTTNIKKKIYNETVKNYVDASSKGNVSDYIYPSVNGSNLEVFNNTLRKSLDFSVAYQYSLAYRVNKKESTLFEYTIDNTNRTVSVTYDDKSYDVNKQGSLQTHDGTYYILIVPKGTFFSKEDVENRNNKTSKVQEVRKELEKLIKDEDYEALGKAFRSEDGLYGADVKALKIGSEKDDVLEVLDPTPYQYIDVGLTTKGQGFDIIAINSVKPIVIGHNTPSTPNPPDPHTPDPSTPDPDSPKESKHEINVELPDQHLNKVYQDIMVKASYPKVKDAEWTKLSELRTNPYCCNYTEVGNANSKNKEVGYVDLSVSRNSVEGEGLIASDNALKEEEGKTVIRYLMKNKVKAHGLTRKELLDGKVVDTKVAYNGDKNFRFGYSYDLNRYRTYDKRVLSALSSVSELQKNFATANGATFGVVPKEDSERANIPESEIRKSTTHLKSSGNNLVKFEKFKLMSYNKNSVSKENYFTDIDGNKRLGSLLGFTFFDYPAPGFILYVNEMYRKYYSDSIDIGTNGKSRLLKNGVSVAAGVNGALNYRYAYVQNFSTEESVAFESNFVGKTGAEKGIAYSYYPEVPMREYIYKDPKYDESDKQVDGISDDDKDGVLDTINRISDIIPSIQKTVGEYKRQSYMNSLYIFRLKDNDAVADNSFMGSLRSSGFATGSQVDNTQVQNNGTTSLPTIYAGSDVQLNIGGGGFTGEAYGYALDMISLDDDYYLPEGKTAESDRIPAFKVKIGDTEAEDEYVLYDDIIQGRDDTNNRINLLRKYGDDVEGYRPSEGHYSLGKRSLFKDFNSWLNDMTSIKNWGVDLTLEVKDGSSTQSFNNFNATLGSVKKVSPAVENGVYPIVIKHGKVMTEAYHKEGEEPKDEDKILVRGYEGLIEQMQKDLGVDEDTAKKVFEDSEIYKAITNAIESDNSEFNESDPDEIMMKDKDGKLVSKYTEDNELFNYQNGNLLGSEEHWYDEEVKVFCIRRYEAKNIKFGDITLSDKIDYQSKAATSIDPSAVNGSQKAYSNAVGKWYVNLYMAKNLGTGTGGIGTVTVISGTTSGNLEVNTQHAIRGMEGVLYDPRLNNLSQGVANYSVILQHAYVGNCDFLIPNATTSDMAR